MSGNANDDFVPGSERDAELSKQGWIWRVRVTTLKGEVVLTSARFHREREASADWLQSTLDSCDMTDSVVGKAHYIRKELYHPETGMWERVYHVIWDQAELEPGHLR